MSKAVILAVVGGLTLFAAGISARMGVEIALSEGRTDVVDALRDIDRTSSVEEPPSGEQEQADTEATELIQGESSGATPGGDSAGPPSADDAPPDVSTGAELARSGEAPEIDQAVGPRQAIYEVVAGTQAVQLFRATYDDVAVRPLHASPAEYLQTVGENGSDRLIYEDRTSLIRRLGRANFRRPTPLSRGGFQSLGYRSAGLFEALIGADSGMFSRIPVLTAPEQTALHHGERLDRMDPVRRAELEKLFFEWGDELQRARHRLFAAVAEAARGGSARPVDEDVVAFRVQLGRLWLVRRGEDQDLDQGIGNLESIRSEADAAVARAFE